MLMSEKVATPATALTVVVEDRVAVPLLGSVPMAMVKLFVAVVTTLPEASCTSTFTAGEMETPTAVLLG